MESSLLHDPCGPLGSPSPASCRRWQPLVTVKTRWMKPPAWVWFNHKQPAWSLSQQPGGGGGRGGGGVWNSNGSVQLVSAAAVMCCYLLATQTHIDQQATRRCSAWCPTFSLHSGFNLVWPIAPSRPPLPFHSQNSSGRCVGWQHFSWSNSQKNISNCWVLLSLLVASSDCKPMNWVTKTMAVCSFSRPPSLYYQAAAVSESWMTFIPKKSTCNYYFPKDQSDIFEKLTCKQPSQRTQIIKTSTSPEPPAVRTLTPGLLENFDSQSIFGTKHVSWLEAATPSCLPDRAALSFVSWPADNQDVLTPAGHWLVVT